MRHQSASFRRQGMGQRWHRGDVVGGPCSWWPLSGFFGRRSSRGECRRTGRTGRRRSCGRDRRVPRRRRGGRERDGGGRCGRGAGVWRCPNGDDGHSPSIGRIHNQCTERPPPHAHTHSCSALHRTPTKTSSSLSSDAIHSTMMTTIDRLTTTKT